MALKTWPGGQHEFSLSPIGTLVALQDACDCGSAWLLHQLATQWGVNRELRDDMLRHVVQFGLEGGGMPKTEAVMLAATQFETMTLEDYRDLAIDILQMRHFGDTDDPTGEVVPGEADAGAETEGRPSREEK